MSGDDNTLPRFLFLSPSAPPPSTFWGLSFQDFKWAPQSSYHGSLPLSCLSASSMGTQCWSFLRLCFSAASSSVVSCLRAPPTSQKEVKSALLKPVQKSEAERILPKAFYKGNTMLIPNPAKEKTKTTKKEDCRLISLVNTEEITQQEPTNRSS